MEQNLISCPRGTSHLLETSFYSCTFPWPATSLRQVLCYHLSFVYSYPAALGSPYIWDFFPGLSNMKKWSVWEHRWSLEVFLLQQIYFCRISQTLHLVSVLPTTDLMCLTLDKSLFLFGLYFLICNMGELESIISMLSKRRDFEISLGVHSFYGGGSPWIWRYFYQGTCN